MSVILAAIEGAVTAGRGIERLLGLLKTEAITLGASSEDVAAAVKRGHDAADALTATADAILDRLRTS